MEKIFEIIDAPGKEQGGDPEVGIGLRLTIGNRHIRCPISKFCRSYDELEGEVQGIIGGLDALLQEAKDYFSGPPSVAADLGLSSDMEPETIWSILARIEEEDLFVAGFNGLGEEQRRKVAEFILTQCNIFAGNAAVFSARYEDATGRLE